MKFTEVAQHLGYSRPQQKVMHKIYPKMGLAIFWATFSQTHLVTLAAKLGKSVFVHRSTWQ
jgi:hypothetical protein